MVASLIIGLTRLLSIILLPGIMAGCIFHDLDKEMVEYEKSFAVVGKVDYHSQQEDVVVILYSDREGEKVIRQYGIPESTGHFSFIVTSGIYYLGAFEDLNRNMKHDPGELAGFYGTPEQIVITPEIKDVVDREVFDIRLDATAPFEKHFGRSQSDFDIDLVSMPLFRAGALADLDDALFDEENGTIGYWKPLTFIKKFGIGIYFSEPYDPEKIPVLFVHGATGTPKGWKDIVSHIDKRRYQAWFYYYPTGIRLANAASVMNGIIEALHEKYRFDRLYITAHSMGGLVSRAAILDNRRNGNPDYIRLFVSMSTPWGGVRMAKKGVDQAPTAIPSWYDVAPGSEFIQNIYHEKLSPSVPFYLFFSLKGDCSLFMDNNDGTIELKSALDYRAQSDSAGIFGFNEDHASIIYSQKMFDQYNGILSSFESR